MMLLFSSLTSGVSANAGPIYMEEYPAIGIAPKDDVDIAVEKETLLFRVDENNPGLASFSANYTFLNPGKKTELTLLFPFISKTYRGSSALVEFNGEKIDYKVRSGGQVTVSDYLEKPRGFKEDIHFDRIVENLNKPAYKPVNFREFDAANLYRTTLGAPADRQVRFEFDLTDDMFIMANGFHGLEYEKNKRAAVSTYVDDRRLGEEVEILILGKGETGEISTDSGTDFYQEEVVVGEYLAELFTHESQQGPEMEAEWEKEDLYNLYLESMDELLTRGQQVFTYDLLREHVWQKNNLKVLLFTLDMPAESSSELSVKYPLQATIDRRNTPDYTYTYAYLLNPAEKFPTFGNLEIHIELNNSSPYIIASSLSLESESEGVYKAAFRGLPAEDLIFTTYKKEKVSAFDKIRANYFPSVYSIFYLAIFALPLLILAMFIYLIRRMFYPGRGGS